MSTKNTPAVDHTEIPRLPDYDAPVDRRKQFTVHPDILGTPSPMPRVTGKKAVPEVELEDDQND